MSLLRSDTSVMRKNALPPDDLTGLALKVGTEARAAGHPLLFPLPGRLDDGPAIAPANGSVTVARRGSRRDPLPRQDFSLLEDGLRRRVTHD